MHLSRRESIRSIVISQRLLGTREIAIFRHVGCGMLLFTSDQVRDIVKSAEPGNNEVANAINEIDFLEFSLKKVSRPTSNSSKKIPLS